MLAAVAAAADDDLYLMTNFGLSNYSKPELPLIPDKGFIRPRF